MRIVGGLFFLASLCACSPAERQSHGEGRSVPLKYAKGFSITEFPDYSRIDVHTPFNDAKDGVSYYLVSREGKIPQELENEMLIRTPLNSIVCTSTTHLPLLEYLGHEDKLVGFPNTEYISSKVFLERVAAGHVQELGNEASLNMEQLVAIQPDLVMGYMVSGDYGQWAKIEELGIPVIINAEYLEPHPLGRAEWIKYMAAFLSPDVSVDSIFNQIEFQYLSTMDAVKDVADKPSVLSGVVYGDAWFMPGGGNYAARILKDAGGAYLWEDDSSSGFLELSFESVYERGQAADFWVGLASFSSLDEISSADSRYRSFKAFQTGDVFNYNKRISPGGGNEYLELGYLRPDIILKDLVKAFHPELLPDYESYFFQRLE